MALHNPGIPGPYPSVVLPGHPIGKGIRPPEPGLGIHPFLQISAGAVPRQLLLLTSLEWEPPNSLCLSVLVSLSLVS